jgi:hypothetical protein
LWGSLLLAGDRLYVSNLEGRTFVVAASPKFQVLARNDLAEPTYAALAVSTGELFLRTYQHLYCISAATLAASLFAVAMASRHSFKAAHGLPLR